MINSTKAGWLLDKYRASEKRPLVAPMLTEEESKDLADYISEMVEFLEASHEERYQLFRDDLRNTMNDIRIL